MRFVQVLDHFLTLVEGELAPGLRRPAPDFVAQVGELPDYRVLSIVHALVVAGAAVGFV